MDSHHRSGLDHLTLTVRDLAAAARFFDAALVPLGLSRLVDYEDPEDEDEAGVEAVGYGFDRVALWLVAGAPATTGVHIAFAAPDRPAVDATYAAALAAGGRSRRAPREWALYRPGRYSAMVLDLDDNVLEAVVDDRPVVV